MKQFEYTIWCNDVKMNHANEVVCEWLYDVGNQEGNLEFLNDEQFHDEMNYAYVLDQVKYADYCWPRRPDNFWDGELEECGITEDDLNDITYTEYDIEQDFQEYDDSDRQFYAGFYALKSRLFDHQVEPELSASFYHRFCEVDIEDFKEIEEDDE